MAALPSASRPFAVETARARVRRIDDERSRDRFAGLEDRARDGGFVVVPFEVIGQRLHTGAGEHNRVALGETRTVARIPEGQAGVAAVRLVHAAVLDPTADHVAKARGGFGTPRHRVANPPSRFGAAVLHPDACAFPERHREMAVALISADAEAQGRNVRPPHPGPTPLPGPAGCRLPAV